MSELVTGRTGVECRNEVNSQRTARAKGRKSELAIVCGALAAVVASLAFVAITSMELLSAARGYTQGEALWSKGQKDAMLYLMRYTRTRSDADYERFRAAIHVPLACQTVRRQMDLPHYDPAILYRAFADAGIREQDRSRMIWLYRNFASEPHLARAIAIWVEAEQDIAALERNGESLRQHTLSQTLNPNVVTAMLAENDRINRHLTPLEEHFSQSLAEAACWLHDCLVTVISIIAIMLVTASSTAFCVLRSVRELREEIEERRRIQEELLAAKQTAEESSRAKAGFMANMSHELRTPLNAIIGYSELLQEEVGEKVTVQAIPDLVHITSAGKHLLALINDVLDFSKIEAGKTDLLLEDVDVSQLVADALSTVQPLARKNGNKLIVRHGEGLDTIHADLLKLRQSLYNLLSNACKFTRDGIVTLEIVGNMVDGTKWIEWRVSDTGIGMAADQMKKLFRDFSQLDASTTREYGGTGLGLAISQRLCQLMGGSISVVSEHGKGSTFTMRLPCKETGAVY